MYLEKQRVLIHIGERRGLMVVGLDSGASSPGSSPGELNSLYSAERHFTPTVRVSRCINGYNLASVTGPFS